MEDDLLSIQRIKGSFVCFLWLGTEMFVRDGPVTLIGWAFVEGGDVFCTSF